MSQRLPNTILQILQRLLTDGGFQIFFTLATPRVQKMAHISWESKGKYFSVGWLYHLDSIHLRASRQFCCQQHEIPKAAQTTDQLWTAGAPFCHKHVGIGVHPKVFISCYFGIWIVTHHLMRIHGLLVTWAKYPEHTEYQEVNVVISLEIAKHIIVTCWGYKHK